jgi:AAHS family 4-hydroxybenzoate transporter-like MFS transporter
MRSAEVNVSELIDNTPLNGFHIRVVGLCACLLFFEGFDFQAISYAAPALAKALAISKPMLGPLFSSGQLGLMVGALLFGIAGDRWGRKRVFIACGLVFGLASLATALSSSYSALVFWRVMAGLGLGGAGPIAITIASDYCPRKIRAALTMIMYCGFTIGGVFAGLVNAYFLRFGWQTVFYVGGVLPILLAPVLMLALPESLNYLISRGTRGAEISHILNQIAGATRHSAGNRFVMEQAYEKKVQVPELFRGGYARQTCLLWMSLFISLITLFSLTNWLPTLLNSVGINSKQIVTIIGVAQVAGLAGSLLAARLIVSHRPFRVAAAGYGLAAVLLIALGMVGSGFGALLIVSSVLYLFLIGDQNILNVMTGALYPPKIRATGSGWAIGVGRIGGIIGPSIAGALLAFHWMPSQLFIVAAIPTLVTAALVFILSNAAKEIQGSNRLERAAVELPRGERL